ncbi:MAG TPA: hypothetical protein VLE20_05595 [Blastocatellia bacterium]|nr:hypothetical protein [Blastocatellia bacterium]
MLNYFAMVEDLRKSYLVSIISAALMVGCSPGANRTNSSEGPPANTNAAIAQSAPNGPGTQSPASTQPAPGPPALNPAANAKTGGKENANTSQPATSAMVPAPKLIVPLTDIDFGKVAQGKSLTRNLVIKNAGKADLQIQSVAPS